MMHNASLYDAPASASRMVLSRGVSLELIPIKVDLPQFARAIPLRLIVEVRRRRVPALAAGRYRLGPHAVAELHHRHEAVAAGAIPLLRPRVRARSERRQRSKLRRGKAHRNAGPRVVVWIAGL